MAELPENPTPPTAEEFEGWLRPAAALALRGALNDGGAVDAFLIRLKGGRIPAFSASSRWYRNNKWHEREIVEFPYQWWDRVSNDEPHDLFWRAPVTDVTINSHTHGAPPIYFFDLRFDPEAVRSLFGLPPPPERIPLDQALTQIANAMMPLASPKTSAPKYQTEISRLGPNEVTLAEYAKRTKALKRNGAPARRRKRAGVAVSHDEFMAWYGALPALDQARGYRWVWREAQGHFRPREGVRKKWAEELSKDRGAGRKTTG